MERGFDVVSNASLPLSLGGVGLGSAMRIREAANWADCLEMARKGHPSIATTIEGLPRSQKDAWGPLPAPPKHLQKLEWGFPLEVNRQRGPDQTTTTRKKPDRATARVAESGVHFVPQHLSRDNFVAQFEFTASPEWTQNHSGLSFCATACLYLFLSTVALVAASSTRLAITAQRVRQSEYRDLDLDLAQVPANRRKLEVVAESLSLFGCSQLALDTTLVSTLREGRGNRRRRPAKCTKKQREDPPRTPWEKWSRADGGDRGRSRGQVVRSEVRVLRGGVKAAWYCEWSCFLACAVKKGGCFVALGASGSPQGWGRPTHFPRGVVFFFLDCLCVPLIRRRWRKIFVKKNKQTLAKNKQT